MITVEQVSFEYPGKRALSDVSFNIEANTLTGLVGPNGAGKTTLLRCIAALEQPFSGKITLDGWETERHPRKIHEITSYLPDFFGLYDGLTVEQCLLFFARSHLTPADQIKDRVALTAERLQLTPHLKVAAGKLSRGLRQRLAIAQSLIHAPKILLLDEPASGLDPDARIHLSALLVDLRKSGMTIIVSSHILAELQDYSTHLLILQEGRLLKHCALSDFKNTSLQDVYLQLTAGHKPSGEA